MRKTRIPLVMVIWYGLRMEISILQTMRRNHLLSEVMSFEL